jgi:raffinose/stachyose/melibiose transport system substrate-binding protein
MYLQGPWALGEIAKTNKDMDLGTFPLPVTDEPADRKVRVNVDLALWIPEASRKQEAAREFLTFLMQSKVNDQYNADNNGFGVRKDAPPASNPALRGMQSYYDDAAFYLGASQLIPAEIPVANYAQSIAFGGDPQRQLRTLDADWARLALRMAA